MLTHDQFLTLSDGERLHVKIINSKHPVWLIVTHGISEHLGRHSYLMDLFANDFNIFFYDLKGHGKSSGRQVYVQNFSQYYDDLYEIVLKLQECFSMERFILFGHSMGATILCGYLQKYRCADLSPEKVFLSSPAVGFTGINRMLMNYIPKKIFKGIARLPSVRVGGDVGKNMLSHDPLVAKNYVNDPLCYLNIHTKLRFELALAIKAIFSRPLLLKSPGYCAYGTGDVITCPQATEEYFRTIEQSVVLRAFQGAYHEIHNETEAYGRLEYFDFLKESLTRQS